MPDIPTFTKTIHVPPLHETTMLQSQRDKESVYHMWKTQVEAASNLNKVNQTVNQIARELKTFDKRNKLGFDLFPFKLYVLPDAFRGTGDVSSTNWRTLRVRGGFVFTNQVSSASFVNGTDMFQQYAYADMYPSSSATMAISGQIPASYDYLLSTGSTDNPVWFWIENSSSAYYLRYNNNPVSSSIGNPNPWTSFPQANSNYIPIGTVDCYTSASVNQALIRQFLTTDVLAVGGTTQGGGSGLNFRGIWTASPPQPYLYLDMVQFQSGTNAGLYYSTINNNANSPTSGIGWVQLSSAFGTFL